MKKSTKKLALQKETLTTLSNLEAVKGGESDLYLTVIIIWEPVTEPEPTPPIVWT